MRAEQPQETRKSITRILLNCFLSTLELAMSLSPDVPSLGKVLVIGGCGFLGSHIVSLIVKRHPQTQVSVLDLRTSSNRNLSSNVSYHDSDITNYDAVYAIISKIKPDAIIHTASPTAFLAHDIHYKVNVEGTKNLVKAAQETGVKVFVFTSSASVILDPTKELINADETWPLVTGDKQPEYYTTTKVRYFFQYYSLECVNSDSVFRRMQRQQFYRQTARPPHSSPVPFGQPASLANATSKSSQRWSLHIEKARRSSKLARTRTSSTSHTSRMSHTHISSLCKRYFTPTLSPLPFHWIAKKSTEKHSS